MSEAAPDHRPIAIFAGGGELPARVADAALRSGRTPVVFAIRGESDPEAFRPMPVHPIGWGEIGRLFRLLEETGCREAAFIGKIEHRPDYTSVRPDFGALRLLPRLLPLMRRGDDALLREVSRMFEEIGVGLVSPLDIAPDLAFPEGVIAGRPRREYDTLISKALEAARAIGRLDIGQAAVAVGGRVVAVEDAGGTDGLLDRVAALRAGERIAKGGAVLVKCMKPQQDRRLDVPTIGPETAERARRAGLDGVAAEAGRALMAGRDETIDAFRSAGLFLLGIAPGDVAGP